MPSIDPLYVTPPKAARMIGIGRTKVYELIRDGRLPATLLDGRYLIKVADIKKFMESLPETVGIGRTKVYALIRDKRGRSNEVGPKGARSADCENAPNSDPGIHRKRCRGPTFRRHG